MNRIAKYPAYVVSLALTAAVCLPAPADIVQTTRGRYEGKFALQDGALRMGGQTISADGLLLAIRDTGPRTISAPHMILFNNGEAWCVEIAGLASNRLSIRGTLTGKREIDVKTLSSLEFSSRPGVEARPESGALYMDKREPVPGKLIWIKEQSVAMECPLGVLTLRRQDVGGFVFPKGSERVEDKNDDEIGLIDGGVLRGKLAFGREAVGLEHSLLGTLSFPLGTVKYIRRRSASVKLLGLPDPKMVELRFPAKFQPRLVDCRWNETIAEPARCLEAVRVQPGTVARYKLPDLRNGKPTFHAVVAAAKDSRADMRIRIGVSGKWISEQEISASGAPAVISLELPKGDELMIAADFKDGMGFPCSVDWCDPYLAYPSGAGEKVE